MKNYIIPVLSLLAIIYSCSTVPAVKPTIAAVSATTENLAQGKNIYENNCGKCHALPNPSSFTDEKWVGIMNWMAPKAKLTAEQTSFAYTYVTHAN